MKRRDQDLWYDAELLLDGYECDLAVLTVSADEFWQGLEGIEIDRGLPRLLDPVTVLGYPTGGSSLSTTQGVVSRIDVQPYLANFIQLPIIQIDAAINPGNSGGPAICRGRLAGVAFSGLMMAQNIGYIVPSQVVLRFLRDFDLNRRCTRFAYPPFKWQTLERPSLRRLCDVEGNGCGVRVTAVDPYSDAPSQGLKVGDVVLAVEGTKVGYDGKVPLPEVDMSCRVSLWYLFCDQLTGSACTLTVMTPGTKVERELSITLKPWDPPLYENPKRPEAMEYLIIAGLVFQPLSTMYIQAGAADLGPGLTIGTDIPWQWKKAFSELWSQRLGPDEQVIVLSSVLPNSLNIGMESGGEILLGVNGQSVKNITELAALADSVDDMHELVLELSDNELFGARAHEARAATAEVLDHYGILADRRLALPEPAEGDVERMLGEYLLV